MVIVGALDQVTIDAKRAARISAVAAGVNIVEIDDHDELENVRRLFERIWRTDPTEPQVTIGLMRALIKAGNYVSGAYDRNELIGACVAFFGAPSENTLHSHVAGVTPSASRRGVGLALKLHQRSWALERGVVAVAWTYDPLVRRNAYFNICKLGAEPTEYLTNFYGPMRDEINGGGETDRILIRWTLASPRAVTRSSASALGVRANTATTSAAIALGRGGDGRPINGSMSGSDLLIAVPDDIETLRSFDPPLAAEWRVRVRQAVTSALAAGFSISDFDQSGWYRLTRTERES